MRVHIFIFISFVNGPDERVGGGGEKSNRNKLTTMAGKSLNKTVCGARTEYINFFTHNDCGAVCKTIAPLAIVFN